MSPMSSFEAQTMLNLQNLGARIAELETREQPIVVAMYTQTTPTAVDTEQIIDFDTKILDTNNCVTVGATWKFTVPLAGYYHVDAVVTFAQHQSWEEDEAGVLWVFIDNALYRTIDYQEWGIVTSPNYKRVVLSGSCLVHCTLGQIIDIRAGQGADAGTINTDAMTWVNIYKVVS